MQITRHFVDVGPSSRRVHYRRCGAGPALLMVHQSPRSSAEYEALMRRWGARFTCIAPDTPGFGLSDALPGEPEIAAPEIADFADATVAFLDALGLSRVAAYGFHSGGIILVDALRRHPQRFHRLAVGGYAVWTPDETRVFGERYLPPFLPTVYGEHLTWLWNRVLEQSWFFPWFDVRDGARLGGAHDDPLRVHATVIDMLDAGDAYRAGYGAVLRAPRDIPAPDTPTPPVLITAYDGDPLQAHIDRLGVLPAGWRAAKVATPEDHHERSLAFLLEDAGLLEDPGDEAPGPSSHGARRFVPVATDGFDGLIHIDGARVDLPGIGLSDAWPGDAPTTWDGWRRVIDALADAGVAVALDPLPTGNPDRLYPDLEPDRFGSYLMKAWAIARAAALFDPWYDARAAAAKPVDVAALDLDVLARDALHRLRSPAARALHIARSAQGEA